MLEIIFFGKIDWKKNTKFRFFILFEKLKSVYYFLKQKNEYFRGKTRPIFVHRKSWLKNFFSFIFKTISYQHDRLKNLILNQLKIFLIQIKPW